MSIEILELDEGILGKEERLDKLLAWSKSGNSGDRGIKEFTFGLRLGFVKNGEYPKIYLHWNQAKFNRFIESFGEIDYFTITAYGVQVVRSLGETTVTLLGREGTSQVLWDTETIEFSRQQEDEDVNWVVGMVILSETGPMFSTQPETQLQLEESSAVAVIDTTQKTGTLARALPKKREPLSPQALSYLAKSIEEQRVLGV